MKSRNLWAGLLLSVALGTTFVACDKDDDDNLPDLRTKEYTLSPVNGSGVTGKVTVSENADRSFNVSIALDKSVKDTVHISHIHTGSIDAPGAVYIPLTSITGTGAAASSTTSNINTLIYDSLLTYNGYINVHYSASKVDSLIAQVNIGKNNP